MKNFQALLISIFLIAQSWAALPARADTDKFMAEGLVKKIDLENRKITLKHGDIKNLDMPGMTMVFRLQEALNVDKMQAGDKVLFHVEKIQGAYVITDIQAATP